MPSPKTLRAVFLSYLHQLGLRTSRRPCQNPDPKLPQELRACSHRCVPLREPCPFEYPNDTNKVPILSQF